MIVKTVYYNIVPATNSYAIFFPLYFLRLFEPAIGSRYKRGDKPRARICAEAAPSNLAHRFTTVRNVLEFFFLIFSRSYYKIFVVPFVLRRFSANDIVPRTYRLSGMSDVVYRHSVCTLNDFHKILNTIIV